MQQRRRLRTIPVLTVAALLAACSGGEGTGPTGPESMQKTAGDNQTGVPGATLSQPLEVKVTDGQGISVPGFTVSFSTSAGSVNPQSANTDNDGRARTLLTLPAQEGTVTVTASGAGVPDQQFTATATAPPLEILTSQLVAARNGLPYGVTLEADGGTGNDYTFSLSAGALPAGLTLAADGSFEGAPTANGSFSFTVRVSDGAKQATRPFTLEVCGVPAAMAVGDVIVTDPAGFGECGVFLPSGNQGDRYRVGVIRTTNQEVSSDFKTVELTVTANGVTAEAPPRAAAARASERPAGPLRLPADLGRRAQLLQSTATAHMRGLAEAEALFRRLGPEGVLREPPLAARAPLGAASPPKLRLDVSSSASSCEVGAQATALLIAEDENLVVYQDSVQNATAGTQVTAEMAQVLFAFYRDYAKTVIDTYFGATGDVDGNGKVILFVTPTLGPNTLGRVRSVDFYSKAICPRSNAGEYIYVNEIALTELTDPDVTLAFGPWVLAHEMKHVTSLYQRFLRGGDGNPFHPLWQEEGGAELSAEVAARLAWSQKGGPPLNETVVTDHLRATTLDSETLAMVIMLLITQETLAQQPNSIVIAPPGEPSDYIYGAGWLFLRFLGDAYGGAGTAPMADADFFRVLHDKGTSPGLAGIATMTGRTWSQLMEEYLTASMVNGQPNVAVPRGFTSYDFVSSIETYCFALDPRFVDDPQNTCKDDEGNPLPAGAPGAFPWPVTTDSEGNILTRGLVSATYSGRAGPSGMRVHDFTSNGSGQGAEINVDVDAPARLVVVRLR